MSPSINSGPRELLGEKPLPGETWSQFLERTNLHKKLADPTAMQEAEDAFKVASLNANEEEKSRNILKEQTGIQSTRLNDLTKLLAQQQHDQFNMDIPGIANTAQGQGFLETSGFGNALSQRYKELTAGTSAELAKQALQDRDLEIKGVGDIGTNANNLSTAGLQRTFSTEDLTRSEALARELAKLGVQAPAAQPSTFEKGLMYSGPVLSGIGSVKGAANQSGGSSAWDALV